MGLQESRRSQNAFTLIELVIVLLILGILAAVAIPIFSTIQTQARNAATKGALAGIREAITQYRLNEIASGRAGGSGSGVAAGWPRFGQVTDSHCPLYDSSFPHVMENADLPPNPWGFVAAHVTDGFEDCSNLVLLPGTQRGTILTGSQSAWRYDPADGEFWANTAENDGTASSDGETCAPGSTTENCY